MLQPTGKMVSFPEQKQIIWCCRERPNIIILALLANTAESGVLAPAVNTQESAAAAPLLHNVLGKESIDALQTMLDIKAVNDESHWPHHLTHSDPGRR